MITEEEIAGSALDYLALGHVHVFSDMTHGSTRAVYPGSPNLMQGTRESTVPHRVMPGRRHYRESTQVRY